MSQFLASGDHSIAFSASRTVEKNKYLLFKQPSLWYFVMAVLKLMQSAILFWPIDEEFTLVNCNDMRSLYF